MGAVLMDGVTVGRDSMVGALSFLPAQFEVPDRMLALGIPAKLVRQVTDAELQWKGRGTAGYRHLAAQSIATLAQCEPLTEPETNRGRVEAPLHEPRYKTR